jgi:hypothetical protein
VLSQTPGTPAVEGEFAEWFRIEDAVDYWEGEQPPEPE